MTGRCGLGVEYAACGGDLNDQKLCSLGMTTDEPDSKDVASCDARMIQAQASGLYFGAFYLAYSPAGGACICGGGCMMGGGFTGTAY